LPIYEFKCPTCGKILSKLCKMGEEGQNLECSQCGKVGLKRLISGFASPGVSGGGTNCSPGCGGNCSGCH
jgi:putative FmdB family regulatory protein